jgi:hypothetical protein
MKDKNFLANGRMATGLGRNQIVLHECTGLDFTSLGIEFHVHIDISNLAVGAILTQNLTGKCNHAITYALLLFNNVKWNYTTI